MLCLSLVTPLRSPMNQELIKFAYDIIQFQSCAWTEIDLTTIGSPELYNVCILICDRGCRVFCRWTSRAVQPSSLSHLRKLDKLLANIFMNLWNVEWIEEMNWKRVGLSACLLCGNWETDWTGKSPAHIVKSLSESLPDLTQDCVKHWGISSLYHMQPFFSNDHIESCQSCLYQATLETLAFHLNIIQRAPDSTGPKRSCVPSMVVSIRFKNHWWTSQWTSRRSMVLTVTSTSAMGSHGQCSQS